MFKYIITCCVLFTYAQTFSQNVDRDIKLGKETAEQIEKEMGIYTHPILSSLVKDAGQQLVDSIDKALFEYQFEIVDMKEPNAFALPGGYVYISRGLLSLVNSKDELIGVLGHEIGHCENRHSIKQNRRRIIPAILQIPGLIIGATVDESLGQIINTPLNAGSSLFLAKYSRKHEKQADQFGINLMAKAGYKPSAFPQILDNLSNLVKELTGQDEKFGYFDSHPYTPKRIEYLAKEVEKHDYTTQTVSSADRAAFLQKLDGLYFWENPDHGVFNENVFYHPKLKLQVTFPEGWATDNQPNMFGAADTIGNESMAIFGILPENGEPKELANEFINKFKSKYNINPTENKSIDMNGIPAHLVLFKDKSGSKEYGFYSLWFKYSNVTIQLISLAPDTDREKLKNIALSIKELSQEEIENINVLTIRIKEAKQGESIAEFSERVSNTWEPNITSVMNNIAAGAVLNEGQVLKVAVYEQYKP